MRAFSILFGATALLAVACGVAAAQAQKPAPPPAAAPVPSDPQTQTASYGDWTLRCQRVGEGAAARRSCEIVQSVTVKGQTTPLAQIAVGRINASDPLRMTVVTPNDISFPSVVRVAMDEKDAQPTDLAWTRCLPAGCFATGTPNADALKRWRASAESGRIVLKTGAGQDVAIPVSFRGLAQAMDALAKEK
jgi:invasion protein IalB